jgi:hypothetical protein
MYQDVKGDREAFTSFHVTYIVTDTGACQVASVELSIGFSSWAPPPCRSG